MYLFTYKNIIYLRIFPAIQGEIPIKLCGTLHKGLPRPIYYFYIIFVDIGR